MSKGELAAHHGCIQKCMGGGAGMSKAEISNCEPKNTPGAKSPASKAEGVQMNKADGCGGEMAASIQKPQVRNRRLAKNKTISPQRWQRRKRVKSNPVNLKILQELSHLLAKLKECKWKNRKTQKSNFLSLNLKKQKKNFEAMQEFLTNLVKKSAPQGKAITSLDVIAKSEASNEEKALPRVKFMKFLRLSLQTLPLKNRIEMQLTHFI